MHVGVVPVRVRLMEKVVTDIDPEKRNGQNLA
jgi:hypothetical protein